MHIEKADEKDLSGIADLEAACFSDAYTPAQIKQSYDAPFDIFYIAKEEEAILAYMNFRILYEEAELFRIAVYPEYRNCGIASQLMHKMDEELLQRGVYVNRLEVRAGNASAIHLYKSFGFYEVARRKEYYHSPTEDAILMEKKIER